MTSHGTHQRANPKGFEHQASGPPSSAGSGPADWVAPRARHARLGARPAGFCLQPGSQAGWFDWRVVVVVVVAVVSLPLWRAFRGHSSAHAAALTPATCTPVAVARVDRQDLYNEVTIPAEFRPYLQVELHAKVSGYVEQINVDIGDRVKAGQLLAKLEIPELQSELDRAQSAAKRAEADYKDAHLVYTRLQAVDKSNPNLVAQQELDAAEARDATTDAAVGAAKAEVEKYQTLVSYTRIIAPFDGVVTHRYADPGSLI